MFKRLKDYFIPHKDNDYAPQSLQKAAILGMMTLILISFFSVNLQSLLWISSDWLVSTILPSVIIDLTNEERTDGTLAQLQRNTVLDEAARLKAEHMATNEYFSHYSPDGVSPWHWFYETNYNFVHAGENLAIHFVDSDEVVDAWMNSPTHRANIMNGNYQEIGVGTARGEYEGYETVYVVQLFGTPAAIAAAPEPEPVSEPPVPAVLAQSESSATETVSVSELDTELVGGGESATTSQSESAEVATTTPASQPGIAGSESEVTKVDGTEVTLSTDRDPITVSPISDTATKTATATATEIAEVVTTEDSVALYSDLISTSTGGIPATIEPAAPQSTQQIGVLGTLTKPQLVLQILYAMIAGFVMSVLLLAVFIEIRRQQPVQLTFSAGLMAMMFLLLYVHISLTSGALVV